MINIRPRQAGPIRFYLPVGMLSIVLLAGCATDGVDTSVSYYSGIGWYDSWYINDDIDVIVEPPRDRPERPEGRPPRPSHLPSLPSASPRGGGFGGGRGAGRGGGGRGGGGGRR
ncbi:MAG: hypothetical protein KDJ99_03490 [Candidatus Competibacteraceae bacterium]|nr:hypothetical protein [Candidatus Competibacteraceae bacterium]